MAKCGNCGVKLGCSCKRRTASDGKSCCANCIAGYEKILKQNRNKTASKNLHQGATAPGVILNTSAVQTS